MAESETLGARLHVMGPNVHSSLHLLLALKPHLLQDRLKPRARREAAPPAKFFGLDDLVADVRDVGPPADRADRVHEAHLRSATATRPSQGPESSS